MLSRTNFLSNKVPIQCFFIDLSGTVHVEKKLTPGAIPAYEKLKAKNKKFKFVTNTSKESVSKTVANLSSLGLKVSKEEIYSSLTATRDYLVKKNLRPYFLVADEALEEFSGINTEDPDAVVIGLDPSKFNYKQLNECFRIGIKDDVELVAINKGRYHMTNTGNSLGAGPFAVGLEYACNKQSTVVGKPSQEFFLNAMKSVGVDNPSSCIMIGDDVNDDVIGAIKAGMNGCLVRTGKYKAGDEDTLFKVDGDPHECPVKERCLIVDNLEEAISLLIT